MNGQRWLLINPPTGRYIREDRCQAPVRGLIATSMRPPVDLAYIGAKVSSAGADCRLIDYPAECWGWDRLCSDLKHYRPTHLVVSTTMFTVDRDLEACRLAKSEVPGVVTLAKGAAFVSGQPMEICPDLDGAVTGDYEEGFSDLARGRDWNGIPGLIHRDGDHVRVNEPRFPVSLDDLGQPRHDLIRHRLYPRPDTGRPQATVLAGRGCAGSCIYCIAPAINGRVIRYRPADTVVSEMAIYVSRYGIRDFYLSADTFTWDRRWVLDFCEQLRGAGLKTRWVCNSRADRIDDQLASAMRNSGCWGVSLGIETGSPDVLARIRKGTTLDQARAAVEACRRQGLVTLLHFMLGFPWDDDRTIQDTISFARTLPGNLYEFNLVTPLPGTALWELVAEEGLMNRDLTLAGADYSTPIARTHTLDRSDLLRWRRRAITSLYLNPGFAWRSIRHMNSPIRLWRCGVMVTGKLMTALFSRGKEASP